MKKLTRRDRAAMVHAYEHLRSGCWPPMSRENSFQHACLVLPNHETLPISCIALTNTPKEPTRRRVLRARLALFLRAILRADVGDCGPSRCESCGQRICRAACARVLWRARRINPRHSWHRRINALWQSAPRTIRGEK